MTVRSPSGDDEAVAIDRDEPPTDDREGDGTTDAGTDGVADVVRSTDRWQGVTAVAVILGGLGVVYARPAVLMLAVVGVAYAAYAHRGADPAVSLSAERELSDEAPAVGDEVEVTVSVTNTGDAPLWDLRLIDGVPDGLVVERGTPRHGTALRPGRTAQFSYVVTARRGDHEFGKLTVLARDLAGTHERETSVRAPGSVRCLPDLDGPSTVPLRPTSTRFTGHLSTDVGGEGLEFHATRAYRPGDAPSRVDWNRYAATRELATLEFRQERAATVVLLIDARKSAFRSPESGVASALERSVDAVGEVFAALQDAGDRVGIAGFGPDGCWLPPGAGDTHRERARHLLADAEAFSATPPDADFYPKRELATVRQRAPVDSQFVVFSPAVDDYVVAMARRLQAHGYPVTVVSPDVTSTDGLARRLAVVERRVRLNRLREAEVHVVDWAPDEPLAVAFDRASEGWSG